MRRRSSTIGRYNGQGYLLIYDRLCNVLAVESKVWVWHLFFDYKNGERFYEGNFGTKREAMEHVAARAKGEA